MQTIKHIFIAALGIFTFYIFINWITEKPTVVTEAITIETIWDEHINDQQKAIMCNSYWTQEYEEVLFVIQASADFMIGDNAAEALYVILNEECV